MHEINIILQTIMTTIMFILRKIFITSLNEIRNY